jgi:serine/threonine protein kinase
MPFYKESLDNIGTHQMASKNPRISHNIMRSAISILDHIHDKYVIHRDIKPANFMIHNDELILIDFGLASFYVDSNEKHISPTTDSTKKSNIIGTPKYASWNIHCGEEYSRRDDLMSVVYIGLFLIYGSDLWSDVIATKNDINDRCLLLHPLNQWFKTQKNLENIMNMSSGWNELQIFAGYIYGLSFQERPSYKKYNELFD